MKKIYNFLLLLGMLITTGTNAQTTLISPTGDGGFESGSTLAANNWQVANSTTDQWTVGTAPAVFAGSNCGYISGATGGSWAYSQVSTIQHLYRDFTVPAGTEKVGALNFKWKALGEGTTTSDWDNMKVFLAPVSITPTANTAISATYQIVGPGAISGMYKLNAAAYNDETINLSLTPGATYRLIFSWKSDGSDIVNPPAALDNISLVVRNAATITSTALGGLWSSPATWQGGVVPVGEDAVIADGAIVTIDQAVSIGSLSVGQGTSGILQWNGTANTLAVNGNVTVNTGAKLNMFTAVASPNGVTVSVAGNFTNNGTVHAAYVNANHSSINFNSPAASPTSALAGSGTFVGGIVSGLFFQNLGNNAIITTQNITTRSLAITAGNVNTNGKLSIDNTAQFYGQAINQQVYEIVVTNMGSGYNSATPPTVTLAAPTGAGITATATPNIDDVTGTLRSIIITNAGDGYRANPAVTITGGTGTGAAAVAVVNNVSIGVTIGQTQKSGGVTITGGININSSQSVGAGYVTSGGVGYSSAPDVGFALPTGYANLITNGGSGYTSAPTVTVSGGVALSGSTNPTFTVVVAQGKVVSVIPSGGGTLWQVPPTLTITGGGGAGATAAYPSNCLATATASISNGMVSNITITNAGSGYTAAPAMGLVGGGFTTAASGATSRVGLYNIVMNWFAPQAVNTVHQDDATIPANRRINALTMTAGGLNLNNNLELYASAPITLTNGLINAGANTVYFSHPTYAGTAGSAASNISGNIRLSTPGGSLTRTFPFDAAFAVATGTGSLATGSTVTSLTVSRTGAPTGTVNPSGNPIGTRAYRLQSDAGAVYGTNPTVTLNYNSNDVLVSDAAGLSIGQGAALSGPWTVVSAPSGAGALPATGSRTTATAAPGPIVPTGDDYFAWTSTYVVITSAASGNWNNGSTWSGGVVPACGDNIIINNTHNVTVNSAGNISKNLTIAAGGTLTLTSGDVSVGCTGKNNSFTNNGTLAVSGGTLRVNGNILSNTGSSFNQSGGDIVVDGNDGGVAATSVAAGVPIVSFQSTALNSVNLTGGVFTIVDPHASSTSTETVIVNGSVIGPLNSTAAHTFRFGDGVSTDAGGSSTFGFRGNWWVNESGLPIGNMIIEGPTGTNRFVSSTYQLAVLKDITVNNGGELRTGNIYMGGNLIANAGGTITTTNTSAVATILLANVTYSTVTSGNFDITDATVPQTIGGAGIFRNAATSPTASTRNLSVQNASATGVTLTAPFSVGSAFVLTKGVVNTTATNLLTVGVNGTTTGTITRVDGMINGPLKKWYAAATGTATLPIGTATLYKPATINFTTAPTTAGTITASFSATAPNFPNAVPLTEGSLIINKASTQGSWFVEAGDGLAGGNYTATFTGNGANDIIDYTKTVLIKRPTAGGDWTLDGTHVTSTGSNTAPVVSRTGMGGFSEFAIGGEASVVLPISIEYFRGTKQNGRNVLDWKVSCYNSPSVTLILERSSDGRQFKDINTTTETAVRCLQPFNYNDLSPAKGINYYRLKSIDADRKISYSNVVALLNTDKGFEIVSLAPNPVRDEAILSVTSAERSTMEIVVSDLNGKQVSKQRVNLIAGNNQLPLNLRNVAAGTYQVTGLTADGLSRTLRFVKQ